MESLNAFACVQRDWAVNLYVTFVYSQSHVTTGCHIGLWSSPSNFLSSLKKTNQETPAGLKADAGKSVDSSTRDFSSPNRRHRNWTGERRPKSTQPYKSFTHSTPQSTSNWKSHFISEKIYSSIFLESRMSNILQEMKHIYPTIPCIILLGSARKPCFSKSYILEEAASENEQMSVTYYKNIWG